MEPQREAPASIYLNSALLVFYDEGRILVYSVLERFFGTDGIRGYVVCAFHSVLGVVNNLDSCLRRNDLDGDCWV
jgi:hypothetical protein